MAKDLKVGDFGGIGMGGRNSGGITGKGGKNVNPVYNDSGGHVKVVPPMGNSMRKFINDSTNTTVAKRKSGEYAKLAAKQTELMNKSIKATINRVRNPK